jgi:hypothetical protein
VHNQANPGGGVAITVSPNEGMSWIVITPQTIELGDPAFYQDSIGTYRWKIPDSLKFYASVYLHMKSEKCMVQVGAPYDDSFIASQSGVFSILQSGSGVRSVLQDRTIGQSTVKIAVKFGIRFPFDNVDAFSLDGKRVSAHMIDGSILSSGKSPGFRIVPDDKGSH